MPFRLPHGRIMKLPAYLVIKLRARAPGHFVSFLGTASLRGVPNLIPLPFSDVIDDELILFPDLFAQTTRVNLNENSRASLSFASDSVSLAPTLIGRAGVVQWGHPPRFSVFGLRAGKALQEWGDWDQTVEPVLTADPEIRPSVVAQRGVIVFKPEAITEAN